MSKNRIVRGVGFELEVFAALETLRGNNSQFRSSFINKLIRKELKIKKTGTGKMNRNQYAAIMKSKLDDVDLIPIGMQDIIDVETVEIDMDTDKSLRELHPLKPCQETSGMQPAHRKERRHE